VPRCRKEDYAAFFFSPSLRAPEGIDPVTPTRPKASRVPGASALCEWIFKHLPIRRLLLTIESGMFNFLETTAFNKRAFLVPALSFFCRTDHEADP
jgi:hypothetical protein